MKNEKDGMMMIVGMGEPKAEKPKAGKVVDVPVSAISQFDGEGDVAPAAGDEVSFTMSGKVVSVNGDMAKVEVGKVNDNEMPEPAPEMGEDEAMRKQAEEEDANASV